MEDDRNYLLMRAEEEEVKAAQSEHEAVKCAHLDLAAMYRRTALAHCPRLLPVDRTIHPLIADDEVPAHLERDKVAEALSQWLGSIDYDEEENG